jgi:hypothetical protein
MCCALAIVTKPKVLATGSVDALIILWSLTADTHRVLFGHAGVRCGVSTNTHACVITCAVPTSRTGPVTTVAFDKREEYVLSGGVDGRIRMWKVATGTARIAHAHCVSCINATHHTTAGARGRARRRDADAGDARALLAQQQLCRRQLHGQRAHFVGVFEECVCLRMHVTHLVDRTIDSKSASCCARTL